MQIFRAALKPMRFHRAKKTRRRDGTLTDVLMLGLCSMASSSSISDKVPLSVLSRLSAWGALVMTRLMPLSSSSSGLILSMPQKSPKVMSLVERPWRKRQWWHVGRRYMLLRKPCIYSFCRETLLLRPVAVSKVKLWHFHPLILSRKLIRVIPFSLLRYSLSTPGLGTPWQTQSTVRRLPYSFLKKLLRPAIWHGVPEYSEFFNLIYL